ncbi:hypothetical protein LSTR_LSTR004967 [Laodelphax striatellus]|uniref:DNA repair protein XRCC4 n=1 Tax=Laodelphax striatellus TaxID=195883 RepID=A0A482XPC5_LAOST|nr:hypothetical protein LSTR_LSTR004967 [Laodelphax striatellus]
MTSDNPKFDVCNLSLDLPENSSVLIKSDWCDTSFSIILFDGLHTWTGEMRSDAIETLSEQLGLSLHQYIKECRNALSAKGRDKGFIYLLTNDTFQWKKESLDMKISFGQIRLEKTPAVSTLHRIINEMLDENLLLKEKLSRTEKDKMDLISDNKHLIEALEESNNLKSKMENDLFERFLKVLNTKKAKIKELKKHRSALPKRQGETKETDNISKYECDTDVDSDSDEEGERDNASSASDKEDRSKLSDKESDSDEQINKCLLPKRNRPGTSKRSLPNKQIQTQKETSLGCEKSVGLQVKQSENQRKEPTKIQDIPNTSSCLPKKVNRSVAFSFVDSDEELEDNFKVSPSDKEPMPSPKSKENNRSVMHSPKKHGRFRNELVEDEISMLDSGNGPSAKVPKIENECVSDESDSSISLFSNEFNKNKEDKVCGSNIEQIKQEPEVSVRNSENSCSESNDKQTKVSVKDLIDGLFS